MKKIVPIMVLALMALGYLAYSAPVKASDGGPLCLCPKAGCCMADPRTTHPDPNPPRMKK